MSWKREAKEVTQLYYGGYCSLCRLMQTEPVPYHKFNFELYNSTKEEYKKLFKIKK